MERNSKNNPRASVTANPVTTGTRGARSRRRVPHDGTAARAKLDERICLLFEEGRDTMYIAQAVNLSEAQVYNVLWELSR
jgi:hypothetical protein